VFSAQLGLFESYRYWRDGIAMNPIEWDALRLLERMVEEDRHHYENTELQDMSQLSPVDLNDAIGYLEDVGAVEVTRALGTGPFEFDSVVVEPRGRFLYDEMRAQEKKRREELISPPDRSIHPIGSPDGFTEEDWEAVSLQKENDRILYVVLCMQCESRYYDTETLVHNFQAIFQRAIKRYNDKNKNVKIALQFEKLMAGSGEHLFNRIARSIIGSDIAVFETSDLNPDVMLEMGIALTWGVKVLPIRIKGGPRPPSDVSGQTWIEYEDSGEKIIEDEFDRRLAKVIERIIAKKKCNR
jgi:hypothetical protein